MKKMQMRKNEQGFTIIELVVVILLLGILTATALPRFIDVTDEAHIAVVDAVEGGLGTGLALYRAQWFADRQPAAVPEFAGMYAASNGWPVGGGPVGAATSAVLGDETELSGDGLADCRTIFTSLLQAAGQPTITGAAGTLDPTLELAGYITGITPTNVTAGFDFITAYDDASYDETDATQCAAAGQTAAYTSFGACDLDGGTDGDGDGDSDLVTPGNQGEGLDPVNVENGDVVTSIGYCDYAYVGQFQSSYDGALPVLRYTPFNGQIERTNYAVIPTP